jgi:hypothetical protein
MAAMGDDFGGRVRVRRPWRARRSWTATSAGGLVVARREFCTNACPAEIACQRTAEPPVGRTSNVPADRHQKSWCASAASPRRSGRRRGVPPGAGHHRGRAHTRPGRRSAAGGPDAQGSPAARRERGPGPGADRRRRRHREPRMSAAVPGGRLVRPRQARRCAADSRKTGHGLR